ncbi:uncharacterized protein N7515_000768 [Penicillium bovifimosum]|uniref:Apple domain-containing protein n=1 Tax=Penicillium bovifimosum TaxID=126998 RepID=A0A9W9HFM5_9EURO|nr:uncharacterized protein N7515_000768 [Penicillium bovifimosum]KAJ5146204.1 hypothetical protein N7515_000768 [Penicillium bovifimosum]
MNLQALLSVLPLVVSLAQAQAITPQQHFNQLCPTNDGQEVEIQPGLFATYHCRKAVASTIPVTANTAADPDACLLACEQSSGCAGSMWSGRSGASCYLVQHSGEPSLRNMDRVVYMTYRRATDPFAEDEVVDPFPSECEDELEDCKEREQALNSQLETCTSQLTATEASARCTRDNGKITRTRGKSWEIQCSKEAECLKAAQNIGTRDNLQQCIEACADRSTCKFVSWKVSAKDCWVSDANRKTANKQSNCFTRREKEKYLDSKEKSRLAEKIDICQVNLNYTIYYPLTEEYISLYPKTNGKPDAKDINANEPKPLMWAIVEKCMEEKT